MDTTRHSNHRNIRGLVDCDAFWLSSIPDSPSNIVVPAAALVGEDENLQIHGVVEDGRGEEQWRHCSFLRRKLALKIDLILDSW